MFCPACGAEGQRADAYCTRCGEWLPNIRSLARRRGRGSSTPEERITKMLVFSALSVAFGLFSAIALYATYLGSGDSKWSVYLAAAFCLVIAIYQAVNFFYALELRQRMKRGRNQSGREVASGERQPTAPALNPADTSQFVPASSVTDRTTELLNSTPRMAESNKEK